MKNCDFVAKGETEEEVMAMMMEHAKMAHPDMLKMDPVEMESLMKAEMQEMV